MPSDIYIGVWTNWSYGPVSGATLTLTAQHGAFLVAFLALFTRLVGQNFWDILAYLYFQIRSTAEPQDALYHQQQAVLRNSSSDREALLEFAKIVWFWRGKGSRPGRRTAGLAISAILHLAAFTAAGILSSRVTTATTEVLLKPVECGYWHYPYLALSNTSGLPWQEYADERAFYFSDWTGRILRGSSWSAACYNASSETSSLNTCLAYGRRKIEWSTSMTEPCPFAPEMCINDTVVQFDTGFLNSHSDFGINSKEDRVEYRRVMTCAPIATEGFASEWTNASSVDLVPGAAPNPGEIFKKYEYGVDFYSFTNETTFAYSNYTFVSGFGDNLQWSPYFIDAQVSFVGPPGGIPVTSLFAPIPQLNRSDADTNLMFLAQNVIYSAPVADPWFQAETISTSDFNLDYREAVYYSAQKTVSVVGCTEQHQVRNPLTGAVTPLSGAVITSQAGVESLGFTTRQMAVYERAFLSAASENVLSVVASSLGSAAMLAQNYIGVQSSLPLPSNQWILEFNQWFGNGLVAMQLESLRFVLGANDKAAWIYAKAPTSQDDKWMCGNQIVQRENYTSFSILGLALILSIGFLFLILNASLSTVMGRMQESTLHGRYRNAEWQADGKFQLQRMAYQHHGLGTWEGYNDMVPVTKPSEEFSLPSTTAWQETPSWRATTSRIWSSSSVLKKEKEANSVTLDIKCTSDAAP